MKKLSIPYDRSQLLFVAGALLAFIFIGFSHSQFATRVSLPGTPVSVRTTAYSLLDKPVEIPMAGFTESRKAAIISAQLAGRIVEVSVTDGQMVTAGQQLVTIKGTAPAVSAGNTAPNASPAAPNLQAQSYYDNLLKEYERYQKLYQLGAVPRRQVEDLAAKLEAARTAIAAPSEQTMPPSSSSNAAAPGQEILAPIIAPIAGKITGITAANEATVKAGQSLMVIDTGGDVRVVVRLQKEDLYLVHSGTKAMITLSGNPSLTGEVEGIFPEIGADSASFRAHLRVDNSSGLLKTGATVNVAFLMEETIKVPALPKEAFLEKNGVSYIYLAVNGKAVRQEVTVGAIIGDYKEITSPLSQQAVVVTSNVDKLRDGTELILE